MNWVAACLDMFQKAIAALDAHELLSRRACRNYDSRHAARLSAYEAGATPNSPRFSPRGRTSGTWVPQLDGTAKPPATFMQLYLNAADLRSRVDLKLQDLNGHQKSADTWHSWFFSSIGCCTSRQADTTHSTNVIDAVNMLEQRALQADKG